MNARPDWLDLVAQPLGFYAGVPDWLRQAGPWILAAWCAWCAWEFYANKQGKDSSNS